MRKFFTSTKIFIFFECILFVIVISGCFNFKVVNRVTSAKVENRDWPTAPKLTGWDDERLKREYYETDFEYATRMNKVVGTSFYHCKWYTKENVFELIASFLSKTWGSVGFLQPERNCGFCHQAAYILSKVLNNNGIDAYPLGLNGHVVVRLKDHNVAYIFDSDYAVGSLEYKDDMCNYIPTYDGTSKGLRSLYKPYTTNKDDAPIAL